MKPTQILFSKLFLIVSTIILFNSCAKDDEAPPSIIGRWAFYKDVPYNNGVRQQEVNSVYLNSNPNGKQNYIEFKENNVFVFGNYNGSNVLNETENFYTFQNKYINLYGPPYPPCNARILVLTNEDLEIEIIPQGAPINEPRAIPFATKFKLIK